ncbi:hypothetical protein [Oceanispirochaeta sp.]|jgi:hypothetical protein|uniref:hypothetical protein n=1 Tax=Oceanispirochaeta sp. TaxID=2035350 RepID=UPI002608150C|nr:hypothetical protein [Oceanispirochaeta sp.]MDA3956089.1 hypothetical protein [Oceanispirochaeta sp.]
MRSDKKQFFLIPLIILLALSCEQKAESITSPGIYLSVMGFNEEISHMEIEKLTGDSQLDFEDFVAGLKKETGTLLYRSVDEALQYITSNEYLLPEELSSIAIITFSDGLDQGSAFVVDAYDSGPEYLAALDAKLEEKIHGVPVSAYTIGYQGLDNSEDFTGFSTVMDQLSNSLGANYLANNISDLEDRFAQMANDLDIVSHTQNLNLTIPGNDNGKPIRFTFDGAADAASSTVYIDGVFTDVNGIRSIADLSYSGLTSSTGDASIGTQISLSRITFPFTNVSLKSGSLISLSEIKQYWYNSTSSSWIPNTEFNPNEDTETETVRSSAIIMLVMDCSSSLGADDFDILKRNVYSFINTLYRDYMTE